MKYHKAASLFISGSVFIALLNPLSIAADATFDRSLVLDIQACSSKKRDTDRLDCFDKFAAALSSDKTKMDVESGTLPDKLGGREFENDRSDRVGSRGLVKSCKKSSDGKWFFIFENGQIWKQVGSDYRRYKDCGFYVTIKKDAFGYRMQIDGQTRKTRIRRHK